MVISIRVNYSNMSLKKIITMSFCEIIYFFYIYTNFLNYLKNIRPTLLLYYTNSSNVTINVKKNMKSLCNFTKLLR